jgi:hypothetical protein
VAPFRFLDLEQVGRHGLQAVAGGLDRREQSGVADGEGGVPGELHESGFLEIRERSWRPVIDVEQALDVVADLDRHDHHRDDALGLDHRRRLLGKAPVGHPVVRAMRLAGEERESA